MESCNDECCFTDLSMPLAIIFIVFTAVTLLSSMVGVGVAVPYLWYAYVSSASKATLRLVADTFLFFVCVSSCYICIKIF